MNTGNAIKIFDAGGLKVTRAVPEKHIINFFWPNIIFYFKATTHSPTRRKEALLL